MFVNIFRYQAPNPLEWSVLNDYANRKSFFKLIEKYPDSFTLGGFKA